MRCGGTPDKPEFFAEQKMCPNHALQGEALYRIVCSRHARNSFFLACPALIKNE
jgi:hypothetical protein